MLDGMFSFVLLDTRDNSFIAARDAIGITPLYVGWGLDGIDIFFSALILSKFIYSLWASSEIVQELLFEIIFHAKRFVVSPLPSCVPEHIALISILSLGLD